MEELDVPILQAEDMRRLGACLGQVLDGGDLVVLDGPLGAGKTTLTQGIAQGMRVGGRVASPTFVIARVHASTVGGPDLVHVDAYRLGSLEELDALDLDASLDSSVTVVEWGRGKVEVLSPDRLLVTIARPEGGEGEVDDLFEDSPRQVRLGACGPRSQKVLDAVRVKCA
ncbi:MAG: tRNA (adenosine(37)-N6)-threonylcarbamoyltransferase complex ATPase subunit type 1 TsaE [Actinomycetaceae bacterium]|nr:tRNA (adenosine(37)-N6)-threonylcarbamoyltransferase complex ATPase subunit type 1 TsaE [Actinomycetaceae bacterium]